MLAQESVLGAAESGAVVAFLSVFQSGGVGLLHRLRRYRRAELLAAMQSQ